MFATLPNTTTLDLAYDERISDTEAYYYAYRRFSAILPIFTALEGDFTFTVVDVDGGSATSPADNLSGAATNMLPSAILPVARAGCHAVRRQPPTYHGRR